MRQHLTDDRFRFCRWRTQKEAFGEDSGPEIISHQGQYFALQVFYAIVKCIVGKLSANCCRTITMTRYSKHLFAGQCWPLAGVSERHGVGLFCAMIRGGVSNVDIDGSNTL